MYLRQHISDWIYNHKCKRTGITTTNKHPWGMRGRDFVATIKRQSDRLREVYKVTYCLLDRVVLEAFDTQIRVWVR